MQRRSVLRTLGAVLTGPLLVACADAPVYEAPLSPAATRGPARVAPSTPFDALGWRLTTRSAQRLATIPGDLNAPHRPRGQYIVVGLTLQNLGNATARLDSTDFVLEDANGTRYDMATLPLASDWARTQGFDGGLLVSSTGPLPPNTPLTFGLVFDVTPGAYGLKLRVVKPNAEMQLPPV